jgi:Transposase IS66 family
VPRLSRQLGLSTSLYGIVSAFGRRFATTRLSARSSALLDLKPIDVEGSHLRATIAVTASDKPLVLLTRRDVEATNNNSERALRLSVIFRRVTNGFRSQWGAKVTPTSAPLSPPAASPAAAHSPPSATLSQPPCPSELRPDQVDRGE